MRIHCVRDRRFRSRDFTRPKRRADRFRRHRARGFGTRHGSDQFAFSEFRQQVLLLLLAAGEQHCLGKHINRGRERHGSEHASKFLRDDAELERAQPQSAVCFRQSRAEPTHVGDARPQRPVISRIAFQHSAHLARGALRRKKSPRLIAQELLLVGEIEIHCRIFIEARSHDRTRRRKAPFGPSRFNRRLRPRSYLEAGQAETGSK